LGVEARLEVGIRFGEAVLEVLEVMNVMELE